MCNFIPIFITIRFESVFGETYFFAAETLIVNLAFSDVSDSAKRKNDNQY